MFRRVLKGKSYSEWFRSSLVGNIVGLQIFLTGPIFIIFAGMSYFDGVPLGWWVLRLFVASAINSLVVAVIVWYFLSKKVIRDYGLDD